MYLLQKNTLTVMAVSALFVLIFSSHGGYAQCSQNNFAVIELQFLDAKGKIFDPDLHQPGDIVQGRVYAIFSGSSTNAFSLYNLTIQRKSTGSWTQVPRLTAFRTPPEQARMPFPKANWFTFLNMSLCGAVKPSLRTSI